jgi:branched-chain amino acid aminotransferase
MINFNGDLKAGTDNLLLGNRAFLFGDGVFETMKILDNRILFLEDHYFRLMAGMRIVRMDIPMHFTMEYFEEQVLAVTEANECSRSARVRITIYRNSGGYYLPEDNTVAFLMTAQLLDDTKYIFGKPTYEVELYKDFYIMGHLLSSVKTTNRMVNITGSIFASENGFDDCLLLNDNKNVIETLQGNLFMVSGNKLITPPISDGCINGVLRKQVLALARKMEKIAVVEESISTFALQKADELFVTNVIKGIQPITKYRKKEYHANFSETLLKDLNTMVGFN